MTNNRSNKPVKTDRGFFRNLGNEIRLVFKLMGDPRVSIWLKALPFGSLIYFIFPPDCCPPIPSTTRWSSASAFISSSSFARRTSFKSTAKP